MGLVSGLFSGGREGGGITGDERKNPDKADCKDGLPSAPHSKCPGFCNYPDCYDCNRQDRKICCL